MRFNPAKSLVDPYAKAISGEVDWKAPIFAYDVASGDTLKMDAQDSAARRAEVGCDRRQV